jgi:Concanavalin A-like lectin/glucanases superfamily
MDNKGMSRSRYVGPFGALTAGAALGAGMLAAVQFAGPSSAAPPAPGAGVLPNAAPDSGAPPRPKAAVGRAPVSLRYTFDGGVATPITDVGGGFPLRPLGQNGGVLTLVPEGDGLAVRYPDRCPLPSERRCARAILEGEPSDELNPGTRPIRYGASILMTQADLADGANVVQKGYSVGGVSEYKLQVDHEQGHPSCVLAGRSRVYRVEPLVDVADGRWHELTCVRTADRLTISVDGAETAAVTVPPGLSIANAEPLRIGGKGPGAGNDQYAGELDNVFVDIG